MFAAGKTSTSAAAQLYVDDVFSTYLYTGNGVTNLVNNGVALSSTAGWSVSKLSPAINQSISVVKPDTGNNVYVGGFSNGSYAARIVKLDAAGAIQWQRGLATNNGVLGIDVDSSSNVYIASGLLTSSFAKYNSSGAIQWQRKLTLAGSSRAQGVATDSSSNVYVGGYVYDNVSITYGFIAKYNTSGALQWQRFLVQNGAGEITKVATDSSSNVYVTGYVYDGTGTSYLILAKYNTSGTLQWQRKLQPSGAASNGWNVVTDSSANVYVIGTLSTETVVAKYNTSGVLQWQRKLSLASATVLGYGITVDSSGNVYGSGYFYFGTPLSYYAFVVKYNTSGALQWQRVMKAGGYTLSNGVAIDGSTNLYVAGSANPSDNSTSATFVAKLLQDGSTTSGVANGVVMAPGNLVDAAGTLVDSAGAATDSAGTATDSATALSEAALTDTYTLASQAAVVGAGGMVWLKSRSAATDHALYDTVRGATLDLTTTSTAAPTTQTTGLTSFGASGFSLGALAKLNTNAASYVSWAFREAPKFFDVVTYTGNGSNRTIAHSLGQVPGMIVVRRTDTAGGWFVYHRSLANTEYMTLNSNAAKATDSGLLWNSTTATDSVFSLGANTNVNASGGTYVAYLFAHDTATDGIIQCGSFTTDASANASVTSLSWEPQWILYKRTDGLSNWSIIDNMRGWSQTGYADLKPNLSNAENAVSGSFAYPTATGFSFANSGALSASSTYIYIAIRRPNKPPTTGTNVFIPATRTGTGAAVATTAAGFATDLVITKKRSSTTLTGARFTDRLRGKTNWLDSSATNAETSTADTVTGFDNMLGFTLGADSTTSAFNTSTHTYLDEYFKRAPGFFDVVCYTGDGANPRNINHNLNVAPEFMIVKRRGATTQNWLVYHVALGAVAGLNLNTTGATQNPAYFWNAAPTASQFSTQLVPNTTGDTYVAYLFATLAGISKVFSYTGNGSSQTINCGFSTGARFVLIKRTDSTGDWYVWDSARGIVADTDSHLSLNTTAAEESFDDSIDPDSTGFIVNQLAATNINVNTATYIGLAIA